ncbi:MAG: UDP-N-acetylmuramoyl-tripeptide--D-alanyl-D-alanine ligase [Armatimonadota bacterium]|nr:UDP-N-acetylmuramoyl-tripeptide--D-alanyl-D-alanine ligase [Armatimonadota bacterium]MDR7519260.1 UDP-N-acetylmuramoyl-tripeptide--D-alanyl-D-alanine ligase [Armatimonadota bacterium]MDR7549754.1 UDP-N-acetylmuramoyl-tripeptide--D-alanyl-D-alanine ligase [Armatimonadota bacterium]
MSLRLAVHDLVAATGGRLAVPPGVSVPDAITGVTTDSRQAAPGDLFVALRGPHTDGHRFVADAARRGAALALVSDPSAADGPALVVPDTLRALGAVAALYRRSLNLTVIGITGSVGKTTTVGLCAEVLAARYRVVRSAESWNAELGVALTLLGLQASDEVAVIEMAMRGAGQIRELVEMARPRIGAVTVIGDSHLELLGSRERIAAAKAELLEGLPPDGVAVVNADDPLTARLVRDVRCAVVRFGLGPQADVRASDIAPAEGATRFILHMGGSSHEVCLPLAGTHQVHNALVAAAVAGVMGVAGPQIAAGLARARPATMRQEVTIVGEVLLVDDSYNASPQSMTAAFEVVRQVGGQRRRVLALGEMRELGPQSREFHRGVGQEAAALSPAFLLAVGPHASWYLEGAAAAGLVQQAMAHVGTVHEAIPLLCRFLRAGDVLLVKGSRAIAMEHLVAALRARALVSRS